LSYYRIFVWIVWIVLVSILVVGCGGKNKSFTLPQDTDLAVAGWNQPMHKWENVSGYLPKDLSLVSKDVLLELDKILEKELADQNINQYKGKFVVDQCKEIVLYEGDKQKLTGQKYWVKVGQCLKTDYLLIPQLLVWQERTGGEWASEQPAKVEFYLYLLDVENKTIASSFHFEKEQKGLTENLLKLPEFVKRKGRWIPAKQLAREGINTGLSELGL